ncbi:MAG: tetratricopeptide repeat protein [Calditrichaeota bacterium]|nr:tetratricopeptide repeat protein [Calditrichota bacterium]MCB9369251.1 tetratricopeptide repeat protein [Calditrichota bacterium]
MKFFLYIMLGVLLAGELFAQQIIIQPGNSGPLPNKNVTRNPAQAYIDRARREEQRGNFDNALAAWQDAYKVSPTDAAVITGIPKCLVQLRKFDEAESFLQEQINKADIRGSLKPWQDPASAFNLQLALGEVKLAAEDEEGAWATWHEVMATQPHNPDALRALINVLHRNRRWEESEKLIREYRKEEKVSSYMALELASSLQAQMNFAGATDELLLYSKTSPTAWQIAQSYLSRFPDDSTVEETVTSTLEQAIKRERKDPTAWRLLAGYAMKSGNLKQALDATIAADSLSSENGVSVLATSQQLLGEGETELSRRGFEKVLSWKPADQIAERAELGLAQCLEAQGQYTEAKSSYEKFITGRSKSADVEEARFHIAEILLNYEDKPNEALTEYKGIFQRARMPLKQQAGMRIGDAHAYMGEFAQAIDAWQAAFVAAQQMRGSPDEGESLLRIARANIWRDSTELAEKALEKITKGSSLSTTFNDAILYEALLSGGGFYGALRSFADADYAEFRGQHDTAAAKYGEAATQLKYGRLAEWCRMQEAEELRQSGKSNEALAALDTFVTNFPESVDLPRAKYLIAVITLEDLHDEDQALKLLQEYLVDYPRSLYLEQARRKARILSNKIS